MMVGESPPAPPSSQDTGGGSTSSGSSGSGGYTGPTNPVTGGGGTSVTSPGGSPTSPGSAEEKTDTLAELWRQLLGTPTATPSSSSAGGAPISYAPASNSTVWLIAGIAVIGVILYMTRKKAAPAS